MSVHLILAANMRQCNFAMHSMLATNSTDDVLYVQELWFDRVGVQHNNTEWDGVNTLGGVAHPNWDIHYPYVTNDQHVKVMMYTCWFS